MNAPFRRADLYANWQLPSDPRKALGSVASEPAWPVAGCDYCWPALIQATHYDAAGKPCCQLCAANPHRRCA